MAVNKQTQPADTFNLLQAIDFKNHISEFSGFVWHGDEVRN